MIEDEWLVKPSKKDEVDFLWIKEAENVYENSPSCAWKSLRSWRMFIPKSYGYNLIS